MKCQIPQISWHSRDPVLSIDFQPGKRNIQRLATGGTDSHVLIWYIVYEDNKSVKVDCASDLYRHNKSVNAVRFSPNGEFLASGDDEGAMFIWQLKEREVVDLPKDEENMNQEDWCPLKLLRGHLEDIYDISWSADGNFLVSASMDNTAIVWDMQKFQKVYIYSDPKGYVQGVAWDPLNVFIASVGSDRALRFLNINTKKTVWRVQRAPWSVTTEKGSTRAKLFYDDTLKSYFRRLCFTPDGELLLVPSGIFEREEEKFQNTTYVFSRHAPNKPVLHLPTGDKYTVAVRCNPLLYKLRSSECEADKENQNRSKSMIDLPYRMVFAVAACDSVLLYDTEQLLPFAYVSNIHYTHLTDLSWSPDGRILCASSTDGYCSFLIFSENELGEVYEPPPVKEEKEEIAEMSDDKKSNKICLESKPSVFDLIEKEISPTKSNTKIITEGDKKEIVPSPNAARSPIEAPKSTKKTKLCTIKNFFASPKTTSDGNSSKSFSLEDKSNLLKQGSPSTKETSLLSSDCALSSSKPEPMEVEEDSIEVVFETVSKSPEKKPKCKSQLFSTEINSKTKSKDFDPDVVDCSAVQSFEDSKSEDSIAETFKADQSDWKLELSQDEEVVMKTVPAESPEVKTNEMVTPKSKRRIPLITVSKTASMSSPKLGLSQDVVMQTLPQTSKNSPNIKPSEPAKSPEVETNKVDTPKSRKRIPLTTIPKTVLSSLKLGLPQDEVVMETLPQISAKSHEVQQSEPVESSEDKPVEVATPNPIKVVTPEPIEAVTPKPKRRIPLITLPKTASMSSPKL